MVQHFPGEQWKPIKFDVDFIPNCRIEVSNFGRLRSFNKKPEGELLKGSMVEGYQIIRLKLFRPREEEKGLRINSLKEEVIKLSARKKALKEREAEEEKLAAVNEKLETVKATLHDETGADLKQRTVNYQSLVHRLVADYFLRRPAAGQSVVGHRDHDKLNNRVGNLVWMSPADNYEHQKNSPHVIKELHARRYGADDKSRRTKLSVTKVMLMKKLLNEGKTMKQLVKQFKVTETHIIRIKKGENWGDVGAAK